MFRRHATYLLPIVLTGLLLVVVACYPATPLPEKRPGPSVTVTSTVAPGATPTPPMPEVWGAAVLEQTADSANLRMLSVIAKPLAYGSFDLFSGEVPDDTKSQVVLALGESADSPGTPVLYASLPITDAVAWHEYSWFAAADGSEGPQIALGPTLPISGTIPSQLGSNERALGDSYRRLDQAGWDSSRARRLLLRDEEGQYQLVLLGCLPGQECDGSPAPGDSFCSWCDSCNSGWCMSCKRFC